MPNTAPDTSRLKSLAAQYPLKADIAVRLLRQLLQQVESLHAAGQLHGNICEESLALVDGRKLTLLPPTAELPKLGDRDAVDIWPPELQSIELPVVSSQLTAARDAFGKAGIDCDPRRIDLYQLGAMLCRAMTGQSVADYLHSPRARGKIPPSFRSVVDGALGYAAEHRFAECGQMLAALSEAAKSIQPAKITDTPGWGSRGFADLSQTPSVGIAKTSPPAHQTAGSESGGGSVSRGGSASGQAGERAIGPKQPAPPLAASSPVSMPDPQKNHLEIEQLGPYRVVARIGGGGMGDVYKAYEESLDRFIAIKVLPPDLARHDDFVRRFRAEATAVAKLVHPNVVQIHAIGEDAGRHYFAMHYVNGESLADLLHRRQRLPIEESLKIIEQCLAGLGAAHRAGMIHRDIKPGNILLDHDTHRALLADFGLVKAMGSEASLTATGMVMGTVDYIPPEQARGQAVDGRADLYSIGVLMYQMLSGRLPFTADSPTGVIFQHAYEQPPPLGQVAPDVPRRLAGIVTRLMAKNPEHRYQSADEVLADIAAYRHGKPPAAVKRTTSVHLPAADRARPAAPLAEFPGSLPEFGIASLGEKEGWRTRMLNIFRRHAPQLAERLENTEQQVDGAIYEYERRRQEVAELLRDAEDLTSELAAQVASHQEAAHEAAGKATAAKNDAAATAFRQEQQKYEQTAADFAAQLADQQSINDNLRSKLATIDGTLNRLRSQRDVLLARLQSAQAVAEMEGGGPGGFGGGEGGGWGGFGSLGRRRWRFMRQHVAMSFIVVALIFTFIFLWRVTSTSNPKKIASDVAAPMLSFPITGQFYVVCKGESELFLNGDVIARTHEKSGHDDRSKPVTLHQGDIVHVTVKSGFEFRAIQIAFISDDKRWIWPGRRQDFHVLPGEALAEVSAEQILRSKTIPEKGRSDDGLRNQWRSFNLPRVQGEWMWAGEKHHQAQFGTVINASFFEPTPEFNASTGATPIAARPQQILPANASPLPMRGRFFVLCNGKTETYLNGHQIQDHTKLLTIQDGDVLVARIQSDGGNNAYQIAFASEDGRWIWSGHRQDFRVIDNLAPAVITGGDIASVSELPRFGTSDPDYLQMWGKYQLSNSSCDCMWIGTGTKKAQTQWHQLAIVLKPTLFQPSDGIALASKPSISLGKLGVEADFNSNSTVIGVKPFEAAGVTGRFYLACNNTCKVYVNGNLALEYVNYEKDKRNTKSDLLTLKPGDVVALKLQAFAETRGMRMAFISEDGQTIWSADRKDFHLVSDDLYPKDITADVISKSTKTANSAQTKVEDRWDNLGLPKFDGDWFWYGGWGPWYQLGTVVGPDLFKPLESLMTKPAALPLNGKFYFLCKGFAELCLNGEQIAQTNEDDHRAETESVTIKDNDIITIRAKSRLEYRSIRIAFLSDDGDWMWAGRLQDFHVLVADSAPTPDSSSTPDAAAIGQITATPSRGKVDDKLPAEWNRFPLPVLEGDWISTGAKSKWSRYAAVMQASLFKSTANLRQLKPAESATTKAEPETPNPTSVLAAAAFPLTGRFYVACNGATETYVNSQKIEDITKPITLQANDIVTVSVGGKRGGANGSYQMAFASEDGRWIWPARRHDFRIIEDFTPETITPKAIAKAFEYPRPGANEPAFRRQWDAFRLPAMKYECLWIGAGGKDAIDHSYLISAIMKPELFQPSDGIPLANKPIVEEAKSETPAPKANDGAANGKNKSSSPKYFDTAIIALGDAGAKLEPGLVVTEFPRKAGSQDNDEQSYEISVKDLVELVGQPYLTKSLFEWKYDEGRNAVAAGYLKIEEPGTYHFKSTSFYDRNFLLVNNKIVCLFRDRQFGVQSIDLPKGYIPIVSVGTVESHGSVTVEWQPPFASQMTAIPENVLFHDPSALPINQ